jgi:NADPH:quinone reductase-like Zn-dependent oxidoreductase
VSYLTVYVAMHRVAKGHSSERILVHRAAAGVGSALLKLGRLAGLWPGALVVTVISSMIGPEIAI